MLPSIPFSGAGMSNTLVNNDGLQSDDMQKSIFIANEAKAKLDRLRASGVGQPLLANSLTGAMMKSRASFG
jgi:hypothetical protein